MQDKTKIWGNKSNFRYVERNGTIIVLFLLRMNYTNDIIFLHEAVVLGKEMIKMALIERLRILFSEEEIGRISVTESVGAPLLIVVDIHGMKAHEAKRFINNLINMARMDFNLIVIHGYNHGTAIKNMLETDFSNPHVKNQHLDWKNPGRTHLHVA